MKRSYLFVPGNRPERFAKAIASGAGVVILDLEDAVPPDAKPAAREAVCQWLREHEGAAWVRVNGTDTGFFGDDVRALASVPRDAGDPANRVERLAFGSVDFQLDAGIQGEDQALLFARSQLVIVSRIARLAAPIDGVTVQIADAAQLERDVARARALGFGAKLCIHPSQIAPVERGLAPSDEELRWARAVVSAFEQAAGNAVRLQGKLIDLPVVERARRLLL